MTLNAFEHRREREAAENELGRQVSKAAKRRAEAGGKEDSGPGVEQRFPIRGSAERVTQKN